MFVGLSQNMYRTSEGGNLTVCSVILIGEIERSVAVYLSSISGTAKGNVLLEVHVLMCVTICNK